MRTNILMIEQHFAGLNRELDRVLSTAKRELARRLQTRPTQATAAFDRFPKLAALAKEFDDPSDLMLGHRSAIETIVGLSQNSRLSSLTEGDELQRLQELRTALTQRATAATEELEQMIKGKPEGP